MQAYIDSICKRAPPSTAPQVRPTRSAVLLRTHQESRMEKLEQEHRGSAAGSSTWHRRVRVDPNRSNTESGARRSVLLHRPPRPTPRTVPTESSVSEVHNGAPMAAAPDVPSPRVPRVAMSPWYPIFTPPSPSTSPRGPSPRHWRPPRGVAHVDERAASSPTTQSVHHRRGAAPEVDSVGEWGRATPQWATHAPSPRQLYVDPNEGAEDSSLGSGNLADAFAYEAPASRAGAASQEGKSAAPTTAPSFTSSPPRAAALLPAPPARPAASWHGVWAPWNPSGLLNRTLFSDNVADEGGAGPQRGTVVSTQQHTSSSRGGAQLQRSQTVLRINHAVAEHAEASESATPSSSPRSARTPYKPSLAALLTSGCFERGPAAAMRRCAERHALHATVLPPRARVATARQAVPPHTGLRRSAAAAPSPHTAASGRPWQPTASAGACGSCDGDAGTLRDLQADLRACVERRLRGNTHGSSAATSVREAAVGDPLSSTHSTSPAGPSVLADVDATARLWHDTRVALRGLARDRDAREAARVSLTPLAGGGDGGLAVGTADVEAVVRRVVAERAASRAYLYATAA